MSQKRLGSGPKITVCRPTENTHIIIIIFFFFALAGQKYKQTNGQMAMQTLDGVEYMYL